ncbi:MAG: hypothetical protein RL538_845 [Candidatus Parcubacteria bacterium]|jgi:hypothetical protein
MKKTLFLLSMAAVVLVSVPTPSYALSCVDPEGMIDFIVSNPDSIVVTATPTEQKEHVQEKAKKDDPNGMYDSGYTGQFIEIEKAHMGTVPDSQWVYFRRDATWNYLCAGEPPKVGSEMIYVLQFPTNSFELQTVTAVYPVGSELADDLLAAIEDADSQVEPVTKADWVTRLHDELKEMAFIIKVKLSEWTFWKVAK